MNRACGAVQSVVLIMSIMLIDPPASSTQPDLPFRDPDLPLERRVDDLLGRLTLEERIAQMMNSAPAIERLGIPAYDWWNECLHGVARAGEATVFPQAIGLAATFDLELMAGIAEATSTEARAKHHEYARVHDGNCARYYGLTYWSPNINIFRDPRWGRGQETYGEDPYLTSRMGVTFVKGLQGDDPNYFKVIATAKHYAVHSGPEPLRHEFDATAPARDYYETYFPAFEALVREGGVYSVMCAYNRLDGEACCGSNRLLNEILRDQWGFKGYVVSDCGAVRDIFQDHHVVETQAAAAALAVKSGTDLNCGRAYEGLIEAVEQGLIGADEIELALRRLLIARFRLGMFDPPDRVPHARIPYSMNCAPAHAELALRAARESLVLLKNSQGFLPLSNNIKRIAVVGPNADHLDSLLGNYNGTPREPVTPLEGLRRRAQGFAEVTYAPGCGFVDEHALFAPIPGTFLATGSGQGLQGEYFDNPELEGEPKLTRVDNLIDFDWNREAPAPELPRTDYSVRWSGMLSVKQSGTYTLAVRGDDGFQLFLDDEPIVQVRRTRAPRLRHRKVELQRSREYKIRLEYFQRGAGTAIQLLWAPPWQNDALPAVNAAAQSDVVIFVGGITPQLEGEEMRAEAGVTEFHRGDRTDVRLPLAQRNLLAQLAKTGKPIVLVLLGGSAISLDGVSGDVRAILHAWYPGQSGGTAIAEALFGDFNPSGRLPVTVYRRNEDLPPFEDYAMEGRTYRYFRGEPQYAFGYGLSYTQFRYRKLQLPNKIAPDQPFTASCEIQNSGERPGAEVVQLYICDLESGLSRPLRSLQGFQRVFLQPGETRRVEFAIQPRQLALYHENEGWVVEPGKFQLSIGGGIPEYLLKTEFVRKNFTVTAK